jgi:hypothetical protein
MHLSRSSSRIVIVTLGIRIMANLPDRKDGQRRVDHWDQSGHFYLAESGHFYLGITSRRRILSVMVKVMKKSVRKRSSTMFERTVVYRGIKIPPIAGRRSATAQAIRDAFRTKSEQLRGEPARG